MSENLDDLALCECDSCGDTVITEPETKCTLCEVGTMQPCDIGEY